MPSPARDVPDEFGIQIVKVVPRDVQGTAKKVGDPLRQIDIDSAGPSRGSEFDDRPN